MGKKELVEASMILILLIFLAENSIIKAEELEADWETYYYVLKESFVNNGLSDYYFTLEDRLFSVFPNTSTQQSYILEGNPKIKDFHKDADGNLFAELDFPEKIIPGENFTASIVFRVKLARRSIPHVSIESSGSIFEIPVNLSNYTMSTGVWDYESTGLKYIAELATQIRGNDTNVLSIISKMVRFVSERVEYPYGEELRSPQYPNQTLPSPGLRGRGDCDDQSALLITMLRSVSIPSFLQTGGIVLTNYYTTGSTWNGHLSISSRNVGWHGWVEAYIPPWGWLPVDITYGYSQGDPLSSITRSASARELVLKSESYSSIDYVAETLRMEERIKNSGIYIYIEEEISKTLSASNHDSTSSDYWAINFIILLAILLTINFILLRFFERRI